MSKHQQRHAARHALYLWRKGLRSQARKQIRNARMQVIMAEERKGCRSL